MKKLLIFLLFISTFEASASFSHWFNKTAPGTRHYWVNGYEAGSSYYWNNGKSAGSRFYWENGTKYPSRYFWENSNLPGSLWYWRNGKGPGSRYYFENGTDPGSKHYWYNKEGQSFDIYFVSMCKSGAIDIPPCELMMDHMDPNLIMPLESDFFYCEEDLLHGNLPFNSAPNSR